MGNRGELHDDERIVRPWRERRWIICRTSYRDRAVPQWAAGLYTPLFFHDEAVALAAGHRPCAECRRDRYHDFLDRWEAVTGGRPKADELDVVLHHSRLTDDGEQRVHSREWPSLPDGTFVRHDGTPALVAGDAVVPWGPNGYGDHEPRPREGTAEVLTPSPTVDVLAAGYRPHISDTALVGGHVFIVAGDITDLHCDAWLLPTDSAVNISDSFCHVAPDHAVAEARRRGFGASRALRMPAARDGDSSTAWLTNIGTVGPDVATYLDGVDAFVTEAVRDLSHLRTRGHRRPGGPLGGNRRWAPYQSHGSRPGRGRNCLGWW